MNLQQLLPAERREERDEALQQVEQPWQGAAFALVLHLRNTRPLELSNGFTGEDLRLHVLQFMKPPHHPNAWGALIMATVRAGLIEPTGTYTQMKVRSSHARETKVYRWATQ